jgi:two-component system chemotaxis response regulator CheY
MKKVLIVDDSSIARMLIKRCLEIIGLSGAEFIEADHGLEALEVAKDRQLDLLVTDLNMPYMDGETLIKLVKANPNLHDLPVIVVTSVGSLERKSALLGLGVDRIINKPVSPATMSDALSIIL